MIPGAAGGQLLGGLVPKILNLKLRGLLVQCVTCAGIGFLLTFQFLLRCQMPKIAGLSVQYFNRWVITSNSFHAFLCDFICDIGLSRSQQSTLSLDGTRDRVVKAMDQRSRGLGFDSSSAGHVGKTWASFESTLPLSTQQ